MKLGQKLPDMMPMTMAWFESSVFLLLAVLHLHWAFGGTWAFEKSLPTNEAGKRVLNPSKRDSLIVGIGLLFFTLFYLMKAGTITIDLPNWVVAVAGWLIPIVFLLRALGDFKYIGFFKKIKDTDFAIRDTRLYSPLCLIIGIVGVLIALQ